jgi:hypothetical protein
VSVSRSIAVGLSRFMLRTDRTPLRRLWALAHELGIRAIGAFLVRGLPGASAFVKGSFGYGEPVFGVSDVDMVAVLPSAGDPARDAAMAAARRERWLRLVRRFPPLGELFHVFFYSDAELRAATSSPCLTYGLEEASPPAAFLGPCPLRDEMGLQERPELYGATREWRLVHGARGALPAPPDDLQRRRMAAWLELQFWWRYVFPVCVDPEGPRLPSLSLKLVAEPARIWLWLTQGEQVFPRTDLLRRASVLLPEEKSAFGRALALQDDLPHDPEAPLAEMLAHLVRLTTRIAAELGRQVAAEGTTDVRLVGEGADLVVGAAAREAVWGGGVDEVSWLPLVDWRARTVPGPPDEVFALVPGRLDDPAVLASAALGSMDGAYLALRDGSLLLLPAAREKGRGRTSSPEENAARFHRVKLRGVQCPQTDPVSFALAEGRDVARFPNVAGWSARDSARRAVAEHRAWLDRRPPLVSPRGWVEAQLDGVPAPAAALARLLTGARAALFLETVDSSSPELPLTVAAVARALSERSPGAAALVEEALGMYADWRRGEAGPPSDTLVSRLEELVHALPPYRPVAVGP